MIGTGMSEGLIGADMPGGVGTTVADMCGAMAALPHMNEAASMTAQQEEATILGITASTVTTTAAITAVEGTLISCPGKRGNWHGRQTHEVSIMGSSCALNLQTCVSVRDKQVPKEGG